MLSRRGVIPAWVRIPHPPRALLHDQVGLRQCTAALCTLCGRGFCRGYRAGPACGALPSGRIVRGVRPDRPGWSCTPGTSECGAGGSAPGWGPGGRRFESCHSDVRAAGTVRSEPPRARADVALAGDGRRKGRGTVRVRDRAWPTPLPGGAGTPGIWPSLVGRAVRDGEVAGSNPAIPTRVPAVQAILFLHSSAAERPPVKRMVPGSIPGGGARGADGTVRDADMESWQSPVYCARLEGGAGFAAHVGSNPALSAQRRVTQLVERAPDTGEAGGSSPSATTQPPGRRPPVVVGNRARPCPRGARIGVRGLHRNPGSSGRPEPRVEGPWRSR